MRKIPVTLNGDYVRNIIGYLELSEEISDDQLRDMYVSWLWMPERKKVIAVSLVPMQSIPEDQHGRYAEIRCPNCRMPVMYANQHAKDSDILLWTCERR